MTNGRSDPEPAIAGGRARRLGENEGRRLPKEPPARESRPSGGRPRAYHFTWVRRPKMSNSVSSPPVSTEAEM